MRTKHPTSLGGIRVCRSPRVVTWPTRFTTPIIFNSRRTLLRPLLFHSNHNQSTNHQSFSSIGEHSFHPTNQPTNQPCNRLEPSPSLPWHPLPLCLRCVTATLTTGTDSVVATNSAVFAPTRPGLRATPAMVSEVSATTIQ